MPESYTRFAISWVPVPGTALARFGAAWTGWCAVSGHAMATEPLWHDLRASAGVGRFPGAHGLHAPLVGPFTLREGVSRWALEDMLAETASCLPSSRLAPPVLKVVDDRVMFIPGTPDRALDDMVHKLQQVVLPLADRVTGPMPVEFAIPITGIVGPGLGRRVVATLSGALDGIVGNTPMTTSFSLMGSADASRTWGMIERYVPSGHGDGVHQGPETMACQGPDLLAPGIVTEEPMPLVD